MLASFLSLLLFAATSSQSPSSFGQYQDGYRPRDESFSAQRLTFDKDGNFQVSIFGDLHFGENAWNQWGPQQDINSVKVINQVLDRENPGLAVLNGDLITGENAYYNNSTSYIDQIVAPFVQHGLPWASTYGNHDHAYNLSTAAILAHEKRWPNARTQSMVPGRSSGVSNYYLLVYGDEEQNDAPELILWFFDSRGGVYFQERNSNGSPVSQPNWIDEKVVHWFQTTNLSFRQKFNRVVPSMAFTHIPPHAMFALQQANGIDPHREPGTNDDNPLAEQAAGWCANGTNSGCRYGGQDIPFMQAITATPGLMALFTAHDHGDTWCAKWDRLVPGMTVAGNGINLCFGQHSGYGGYGRWIRGARQVLVSTTALRSGKWEAETWIRLEDGSVVGRVDLNSTFGNDVYPATPNNMTYCPTCNYSIITPMP